MPPGPVTSISALVAPAARSGRTICAPRSSPGSSRRWSKRSASTTSRRWDEGLPDWEVAPGHMNLRVTCGSVAWRMAYDMVEYGKMRYNLLGNGGHWFPGLNAAAAKHLSFEKALEKSPFADQIPGWLVETHEMLGAQPVTRLSRAVEGWVRAEMSIGGWKAQHRFSSRLGSSGDECSADPPSTPRKHLLVLGRCATPSASARVTQSLATRIPCGACTRPLVRLTIALKALLHWIASGVCDRRTA